MTNEVKKDVELTNEERQPCEVWTRVMATTVRWQSFNTGKKGEFAERVCFTEKRAAEHDCQVQEGRIRPRHERS